MSSRRGAQRTGSLSAAVEAERRRRAQQVRDLQDDERFDRWRTPAAHRGLVVVGYLLAVGSGGIAWVDPSGPAAVMAPLVFLAAVGIGFLLHRVERHVADADDDVLDERAIALRDRAFHRSYPVLIFGILFALLALIMGLGDDVEARHLQALFYAYGAGALITPLALLAWGPDEF
jgi:uncharacterized membrane protein